MLNFTDSNLEAEGIVDGDMIALHRRDNRPVVAKVVDSIFGMEAHYLVGHAQITESWAANQNDAEYERLL